MTSGRDLMECPKCSHPKDKGKQFCQKCGFNIAYWIRTGVEYEPSTPHLPFTRGL